MNMCTLCVLMIYHFGDINRIYGKYFIIGLFAFAFSSEILACEYNKQLFADDIELFLLLNSVQ